MARRAVVPTRGPRLRRPGWLRCRWLAACGLGPSVCRASSPPWEHPSDVRRTAYGNLSAALEWAGCRRGGGVAEGTAPAPGARIADLACSLGCAAQEDALAKAFEPWWDHPIPPRPTQELCRGHGSLMFAVAWVDRRLLLRCCGRDKAVCRAGEERIGTLLALLHEVLSEVDLPAFHFKFGVDADQAMHMDRTYWSPSSCFQFYQSRGHWGVPLPNPNHVRAHMADELGDGSAHRQHLVPWDEKIGKVFWRGGLTEAYLSATDFGGHPRVRLARLAQEHPTLFDVAFVGLNASSELLAPPLGAAARALPVAERVTMAEELPKFRYVINVNALKASWRLTELLAAGSVMLLQEDNIAELAKAWLVPWEHYVPIDWSLSDLVDKVDWLEANPEEARAIAARGLDLFRRRVRRQDTYCYLMQAFATLVAATAPEQRVTAPATLLKRRWTEFKPRSPTATWSSRTLQDLVTPSRADL